MAYILHLWMKWSWNEKESFFFWDNDPLSLSEFRDASGKIALVISYSFDK